MTTERDEWRPRNEGSNDEGYNRERRPYQPNSRTNNGYGRSDNRGNYNRPNSNYDRQGDGGYNRRPNYDRQSDGYNSYDNRNSYNQRPQRQYDNQSGDLDNGGQVRKRRPRVGENTYQPRGGGYNNDQRGGYNDQRGGYNDQRGGYNNDRRGGYNNNRNSNYQQRPQLNRRPGGDQQRSGNYNPNAKYSVQKQLKYREENFDPNEPIRLNKYLANAGVCSRREADEFIQAGLVKVNGVVVNELGTKVRRADEVMFHDEPIKLEQKVYVLLNKPKNCVTTADDPQERLTVMDLVRTACHERIFPVGRLDRNTTGVLLLTNDGDLASKLTHPKFMKKKIYHVWLDKDVAEDDMQKMVDGIELEDGEIHADAISYVTDDGKDQVGIEIHSGRNRIVRRMFESLGYHVMRLDRVYFAGLTKKNLKRGKWRYLSEKEVSMLRMGAFE